MKRTRRSGPMQQTSRYTHPTQLFPMSSFRSGFAWNVNRARFPETVLCFWFGVVAIPEMDDGCLSCVRLLCSDTVVRVPIFMQCSPAFTFPVHYMSSTFLVTMVHTRRVRQRGGGGGVCNEITRVFVQTWRTADNSMRKKCFPLWGRPIKSDPSLRWFRYTGQQEM